MGLGALDPSAMDKALANAFGALLKEARLSKGISQEQLAFESGLDRTFISMLERGVRQPSLSTMFQIKRVLKISLSDLIGSIERKYKS